MDLNVVFRQLGVPKAIPETIKWPTEWISIAHHTLFYSLYYRAPSLSHSIILHRAEEIQFGSRIYIFCRSLVQRVLFRSSPSCNLLVNNIFGVCTALCVSVCRCDDIRIASTRNTAQHSTEHARASVRPHIACTHTWDVCSSRLIYVFSCIRLL